MSSHVSSKRGFAGWLRHVLGADAATKSRHSERAHAAQTHESPPPLPIAPDTTDVGWFEYAPKFAPFAKALALELSLPIALGEEEERQVETLAELVLHSTVRDAIGPSAVASASLRVLTLVAQPDLEVNRLATAISQDASLTAAVLRVANSAGGGAVTSEVRTVRDAVMRLGVGESGRVAGAVAAKTLFSPSAKAAQALFAEQFAEQHLAAVGSAAGAAQLAMERGAGRSDHAYLGGMLHDVGKSLALSTLANLVLSERAPRTLSQDVLAAILERHHVELGAQAQERWGLPQYLTDLCASHHDANVPADSAHIELHLVRVASGLLALRVRAQPAERLDELVQSLGALQVNPLQVRALDTGLRCRAQQARSVLDARH